LSNDFWGSLGHLIFNAGQLHAMYLRAARAYIHWPKAVFGTQKPVFFDLSERF
jgi:hypothetical protein